MGLMAKDSLSSQGSPLAFSRRPAHPALAPYVRNYWRAVSSRHLDTPIQHRIVPDGCIDIVISRQSITQSGRMHSPPQ